MHCPHCLGAVRRVGLKFVAYMDNHGFRRKTQRVVWKCLYCRFRFVVIIGRAQEEK